MKYTLNIGLHGTNYSKVVEAVNNARGTYFDDYHMIEQLGEYEDQPEPTAVITFETKADLISMVGLVKKWCANLNQTCIALEMTASEILFTRYPQTVDSSFGVLIYHSNYRGKQLPFDSKYFLRGRVNMDKI
jgi:hypothetical protein|tara:strand:+ start:2478 stop:2873 length:396 start_codon:yes stop_codon:yes gene_type:complete